MWSWIVARTVRVAFAGVGFAFVVRLGEDCDYSGELECVAEGPDFKAELGGEIRKEGELLKGLG